MSIPNRVLEKLGSDEEIVYQFEKPFRLKSPGLVFTNKRLIYYKPKSSGLKLEQYSWRDIKKISIKEGLVSGEIEFEMIGDHEIEFEDIPKSDIHEMQAIATELKENAYSVQSRAAGLAGGPRPSSSSPTSGQIVSRRSDVGFMARMWTAVQAKMNRMMGIEDPRTNLEQSYDKQLLLLQDVRSSVAQFSAYCERMGLQREKLQLSMERLEGQAREALLAGREELARKALENRAVLQVQADSLDQQIAALEEQHQKLIAAESRLAAKVEAFRAKKEAIKAEYSAAEAQVRLAESLTGISEEMADVGLAVEQAEERTENMKARSAALDELLQCQSMNDTSGFSGLEQEIALIKAQGSVDLELDRIKAEINKG
ncbi:MAG TPA: PspA/IM30 family protein [Methanothrix sp.]|nr:PspA/IM30 family protein [Methanothrix sp.]